MAYKVTARRGTLYTTYGTYSTQAEADQAAALLRDGGYWDEVSVIETRKSNV